MGIRVAPSEAASRALTADGLASRLEGIGEERYHHQHPFHLLMHEGRLTPGQLPAWAFNRYYYQSRVPMKDAIVLSRSEDPGVRRAWRKRLVDQDGHANAGGLECWVQLAEATGLPEACDLLRGGAPGGTLRGGCLPGAGGAQNPARSGGLLADGTVREPFNRSPA